jgi:hypothetical protein
MIDYIIDYGRVQNRLLIIIPIPNNSAYYASKQKLTYAIPPIAIH